MSMMILGTAVYTSAAGPTVRINDGKLWFLHMQILPVLTCNSRHPGLGGQRKVEMPLQAIQSSSILPRTSCFGYNETTNC
jgi:hypothetical protein